MLLCYTAGIHAQAGHIFLLFHDSYPRPNRQVFLLHVKKQVGHSPPSNLINMKRMQFLIGLFDRAHKSPITESISFKRQF